MAAFATVHRRDGGYTPTAIHNLVDLDLEWPITMHPVAIQLSHGLAAHLGS